MAVEPQGAYDAVGEQAGGLLFGTEQLSPQEAERLLARGPARLVVLIGEQGAGKTTLCTELYERQRHGADAVRFAGSWTLLALEQLAYRRRTTGTVPATRADLDPAGRQILHLALAAGETRMHVLLADLSGELFRRLADNQLAATSVPWLQRADKLVLMVDGERLLDAGARSSTLTRVRQLLERLRSSGLPRAGARLALLVSKWDMVRADSHAVAYWEPREAELLDELRAIDPDAIALRVGAGDRSPQDGFAALHEWLLELAPPESASVPEAPEQPAADQPAVAAALEWPADRPRRLRLPWRWRR